MSRFLKIVVASASLAMLAGCASGGASLATRERGVQTDVAYVARVESMARRRGVAVRWVNPPREVDRKVAIR